MRVRLAAVILSPPNLGSKNLGNSGFVCVGLPCASFSHVDHFHKKAACGGRGSQVVLGHSRNPQFCSHWSRGWRYPSGRRSPHQKHIIMHIWRNEPSCKKRIGSNIGRGHTTTQQERFQELVRTNPYMPNLRCAQWVRLGQTTGRKRRAGSGGNAVLSGAPVGHVQKPTRYSQPLQNMVKPPPNPRAQRQPGTSQKTLRPRWSTPQILKRDSYPQKTPTKTCSSTGGPAALPGRSPSYGEVGRPRFQGRKTQAILASPGWTSTVAA